jgi:beta-glucosidase
VHILGSPAVAFPVGMVQASSWNLALEKEVGKGLAKDMAFYHASVLLGPGLNIHRDPLGGRNFEYFSEDPLLSGKMAAAYIQGVQANGLAATVKHFLANNQEANRVFENASIPERALREIYLRSFEIAIKEGQPRCLMTCYNQVDGSYVSSNPLFLKNVLRGEWGFQGLVMTDWWSNSGKAMDLEAGTDLLMGGYSAEKLLSFMAKEDGKEPSLSLTALKRAVSAVLSFVLESPETARFFKAYPEGKAHE